MGASSSSFPIFNNVNDDLKSTINLFYVFKTFYQPWSIDNCKNNAFIVTLDDKVFALGGNDNGVCGLSHNDEILKPTFVPELSEKNVKEFFNGMDFVLCLTNDNNLYSWGRNNHGQLGIGTVKENRFYEPQLVEFFNEKEIVQVCCGERHSLILTNDGMVYGWGDNYYGQTGHGNKNGESKATPDKWQINNKLRNIHCSLNQSFAVTEEDLVYFCGSYDYCQLETQIVRNESVFIPKMLDTIRNVKYIVTSYASTYFITNDNYIFRYELPFDNIYIKRKYLIEKIYKSIKSIISNFTYSSRYASEGFKYIRANKLNFENYNVPYCSNYILNSSGYGIIIGDSSMSELYYDSSVYELYNDYISESQYKTFEEFFAKKYGITYTTLHYLYEKCKLSSCKSITKRYIPHSLKHSEHVLDKFEIGENIPENLKTTVKYFHIFKTSKSLDKLSLLFVTKDDKVYATGCNDYGILGLGHSKFVGNFEIIAELCDKSITNFYIGNGFIFGLTSHNFLYRWGSFIDMINVKPILIKYFNDKNIVQVCCGKYYSSVLTSDGKVYFWDDSKRKISKYTPLELEFVRNVKSIYCFKYKTFALTECGNVYYWENRSQFNYAILIETANIINVAGSSDYQYLIQNNSIEFFKDKNMYQYKITSKIEMDLGNNGKNSTLCTISTPYFKGCPIMYNENCVYELKDNNYYETKYKNPFDYYCDRYGITYETIEIKKEEELTPDETIDHFGSDSENIVNTDISSEGIFENKEELSDNCDNKDCEIISLNSVVEKFTINFVQQENHFSNILKPFSIANKIEILKSFIKYFYVFDDQKGYNMLFVTNDENVFGFGSNQYGCCGLGHNNEVNDPQYIKELCNKNVIQFFSGLTFALGLTNDKELYAWGNIDYQDNNYPVPVKIFEFESSIENLCCSHHLAIVLTSDGLVYRWGHKQNGEDTISDSKPIKFDKLPKIKLVACFRDDFSVVDHDNNIYSWDHNLQEFICSQFPYDISCICFKSEILIVFPKNMKENLCQLDNYDVQEIECDPEIISLVYINSYRPDRTIIVAVTEDGVYYLNESHELMKCQYKTAYEYFAEEYQLTYKTIDLKLQNEIQMKELIIKGNKQQ